MTGRATAHANGVSTVRYHAELCIEGGHGDGLSTVDVGGLIDTLQGIRRQIIEFCLQFLKQRDDMLPSPTHTLDDGVGSGANGLTGRFRGCDVTLFASHLLKIPF